jgi:hypothetical protein
MSLLLRKEHRGPVNRFADSQVSAATADISHLLGDIGITWIGYLFQQVNGSHDLSALAVATLGHVFLDPRLLDWMQFSVRESQAFDSRNLFAGHRRHLGGAGSPGTAIYMNGTGAATANAAAKFCALQHEVIAKNPK